MNNICHISRLCLTASKPVISYDGGTYLQQVGFVFLSLFLISAKKKKKNLKKFTCSCQETELSPVHLQWWQAVCVCRSVPWNVTSCVSYWTGQEKLMVQSNIYEPDQCLTSVSNRLQLIQTLSCFYLSAIKANKAALQKIFCILLKTVTAQFIVLIQGYDLRMS